MGSPLNRVNTEHNHYLHIPISVELNEALLGLDWPVDLMFYISAHHCNI